MTNLLKKLNPFLFIASILFLFYRYFNLPNRIVFDWDQETLAYQMRNLILNHDIFLIGHRATDVKGFYFGPFYEYLQVPFFIATNLHPIALMYFTILINFVFLILSYVIIKKLFNTSIAIGFIFLWAINPSLITYDITMWAPILIPTGIIVTFYFLARLYKQNSLKNWMFLGLCLGFFTQIHSLFFAIDLFAFTFIVHMLLTIPKQRKHMIRNSIISLFSFLIFTAPLILFDLKYNFLNLSLVFEYFFHRTQGVVKFGESLQVFTNFMKPIIPFNNLYLVGLLYIGFLILLIYQIKRQQGFHRSFYVASLVLWISTALVYLKFTQRPSEYYFLYLIPIITLTLLQTLHERFKYGISALCIYVLLLNIPSLHSITQSYSRGLHEKVETIAIVKSYVQDKKFSVAYDLPLGLATGYDYLFDYFNIPPSKNIKDPQVILRSPPRKGDIVISQLGIHIPRSLTTK